MVKLFFSYSHRDEELRNELEIHLTSLRRQGLIDSWHDRRISAGDEFENVISDHLETADIILLLVSPYFIASDYCYEVEMKRAMERHEVQEAVVVPVILESCNWQGMVFGKLLATPTDGKPISKYPNFHEAFLEVTKAVEKVADNIRGGERVLGQKPEEIGQSKAIGDSKITVRSSNLRIKKTFTDFEKNKFLHDAFEYMANFFEGSLNELEKRNAEIQHDFKRVDANRFSATIYISGKEINKCHIWLGDGRSFYSGIIYSEGEFTGSSYHESVSVEDDGYALFLKPLGMRLGLSREEKLNTKSLQGASEYYWEIFIERLQ